MTVGCEMRLLQAASGSARRGGPAGAVGCFWLAWLLTAVVGGRCVVAADESAAAVAVAARPVEARGLVPLVPAEQDDSAAALRAYQQALVALYGGRDRDVPLDVKAEHFEWLIDRYLFAPYHVVHHTVLLPEEPGGEREFSFGDDVSTWNGALLAALSYKYAVTRDQATLARIARLVEGLSFLQTATGQPGLIARCALERDTPFHTATLRYEAADGRVFHVRSDAAKGTYNQVVGGYAVMMLLAYDDLPPETQALARNDLQELAFHLVRYKYRLTERDGRRTSYGDLRPVVATVGVPFNAQVAYMIISAGHHFPGDDPAKQKRIAREYERLREKYRVYYQPPLTNLVLPQRVGNSPFVKGMNDRNHVLNAAYVGLLIELEHTRRHGKKADRRFLYELGRTMYWTMLHIEDQYNALCNLMWAGILTEPRALESIVPAEAGRTRWQVARCLAIAFEQLRRFPIDRFARPGVKVETREPQWVDARRRHDSYFWKSGPYDRWEETGPPTNHLCASIDYLHAYWLMRYWRLDGAGAPAADSALLDGQ